MIGLAVRIAAMELQGLCGETGTVSAQISSVGLINAPMTNSA
jgi:hypothetical protein